VSAKLTVVWLVSKFVARIKPDGLCRLHIFNLTTATSPEEVLNSDESGCKLASWVLSSINLQKYFSESSTKDRFKAIAYRAAGTGKTCVKYILCILCFVDRAFLYNLFQKKPTRCTLLLGMFVSISLHVSGNYVPIIRRTYCIYATLVFFTLYGWLSGLGRPDSHPYRVKNTSVA